MEARHGRIVRLAGLLALSTSLAICAGAEGRQEQAQGAAPWAEVDRLAAKVEPKVVAWRRDIHQHP